MNYAKKLEDERWMGLACRIRKRDGNRCLQCGSGGELHIHHSHYRQKREPWEYRESDLFTLCRKCHEKNHSIEPVELEAGRSVSSTATEIDRLRMAIEGYVQLISLPNIEEKLKPLIFDGIMGLKRELEGLERKRRESYAHMA